MSVTIEHLKSCGYVYKDGAGSYKISESGRRALERYKEDESMPKTNTSNEEPKKFFPPPRNDFYYLACPHSHPNPIVRSLRYESAVQCQAKLVMAGMSVFNPIVMSHEVDLFADGGISHAEWLRFDYPFLIHSVGMFILKLPGWQDSKGVKWEKETMRQLGRPIIYIPGDNYLQHWPEDLLKRYFSWGER